MSGRVRGLLVTMLLLAALGGGITLGARIGDRVTAPGTRVVAITDPALANPTPQWALRSAGGFTGFGGPPALAGDVFRSGALAADGDGDSGELLVEGPSATTTVRYEGSSRLFRIEPATDALAAGDVVVVRTVDGTVRGILRVRIAQQSSPSTP